MPPRPLNGALCHIKWPGILVPAKSYLFAQNCLKKGAKGLMKSEAGCCCSWMESSCWLLFELQLAASASLLSYCSSWFQSLNCWVENILEQNERSRMFQKAEFSIFFLSPRLHFLLQIRPATICSERREAKVKQESFGQRLQLELRDINLSWASDVESCKGCDLNHLTQLLQGGTQNRHI